MNIEKKLEITASSLQDTLQLAGRIGKKLKGQAVIELRSDVGGGKTTFVQGLVKGMGSHDQVTSPTFTISNHYWTGVKDLTIHHFDFYRLTDPGVMKSELHESVSTPGIVTVVEWAEIVKEVMPDDRLLIEFFTTSETSRQLTLSAGRDHLYLLEGLRG